MSPTRAPPSDAVQKCRDVLDALRDFEQSTSPADLELEISGEIEELREVLGRPHIKVRLITIFICAVINFMRKNIIRSTYVRILQKSSTISLIRIKIVLHEDCIFY